jgi:hypothetical protein
VLLLCQTSAICINSELNEAMARWLAAIQRRAQRMEAKSTPCTFDVLKKYGVISPQPKKNNQLLQASAALSLFGLD